MWKAQAGEPVDSRTLWRALYAVTRVRVQTPAGNTETLEPGTLLWGDLRNKYVWVVLFVTLGFGVVGWVDDWRKVVNKDPEGMRSREKYMWQSIIGLVAALYLVFSISESNNLRVVELFYSWVKSGFDVNLPPKAGLLLPFIKEVSYPLGVFGFVIMTYLVIVGSSNAVNLTDGLDGLAIMPVMIAAMTLGVISYVVIINL